jgi:hypothetical protein
MILLLSGCDTVPDIPAWTILNMEFSIVRVALAGYIFIIAASHRLAFL